MFPSKPPLPLVSCLFPTLRSLQWNEKDSRDISNDDSDQEEAHELWAQEGNGKFERETQGAHAEPDGECPEEKAAGVSEMRAEMGFKREGDHGK